MTSSLIPQGLVDQLGWSGRLDQVTRMSPGLSGALVYRAAVRGLGEFAIKRLPAGTDPVRISRIHRFIDAIRGEGAQGLPEFQRLPTFHGGFKSGGVQNRRIQSSVIQVNSQLWEASSWQPGKPLGVDAGVAQIAAGARAIGAFHRASMNLRSQTAHQNPKSIAERIDRLSSVTTDLPSSAIVSQRYLDAAGVSDLAVRNRFETALADAMTTLRQGWPIVGGGLLGRLEHWDRHWDRHWDKHWAKRSACQPAACCFVMRDIHRGNALFDGGQVRFIDFDAARIDTPALDLARWVGSFLAMSRGDSEEIVSASLAEYSRENPSSVSETTDWNELVSLLQQSGAWGSLANWVDWVVQGRLFEAGAEAVMQRICRVADAARASLCD